MKRLRLWFTLAAMAGWATIAVPVHAQLNTCLPPNPDEYLLLVVSQTPESQAQVRRSLPPNASAIVCRYLDTTVTRVEGFTNLDIANAWAKYMTDVAGLPAFVAQPSTAIATTPTVPQPTVPQPTVPQPNPTPQVIPPTTRQPSTTTRPSTPASTTPVPSPLPYNPKLLGAGYAVLVDYDNRPEVAAQLRQILGRDVGFVSYEQRPYLLANHTPAQGTANATQKVLRDRGFRTVIVEGQRVVLMSRTVRY